MNSPSLVMLDSPVTERPSESSIQEVELLDVRGKSREELLEKYVSMKHVNSCLQEQVESLQRGQHVAALRSQGDSLPNTMAKLRGSRSKHLSMFRRDYEGDPRKHKSFTNPMTFQEMPPVPATPYSTMLTRLTRTETVQGTVAEPASPRRSSSTSPVENGPSVKELHTKMNLLSLKIYAMERDFEVENAWLVEENRRLNGENFILKQSLAIHKDKLKRLKTDQERWNLEQESSSENVFNQYVASIEGSGGPSGQAAAGAPLAEPAATLSASMLQRRSPTQRRARTTSMFLSASHRPLEASQVIDSLESMRRSFAATVRSTDDTPPCAQLPQSTAATVNAEESPKGVQSARLPRRPAIQSRSSMRGTQSEYWSARPSPF